MEDADSGQPKAKKKKTEKGNEKRWWYVELFSFFFILCVCVPFTIAKQQQLLRSCESFNVTFNWFAFFRFLDRLTQNYELKSG